MTQSQIKNIFFVLLSCLLFFLDITLFALMQHHDIYLLLCMFIALIAHHPQNRALVTPLFLLSAMSYLEINIFGWCLVYIIPTILFENYLDQHLRIKSIIPYFLLIFMLFIKISINSYIHGISPTYWHMAQNFSYNTAILSFFLMISSYLGKKIKSDEVI